MTKSLSTTIIIAIAVSFVIGFLAFFATNAQSMFDKSTVGSAFSNSATCKGETGLMGATLKSLGEC